MARDSQVLLTEAVRHLVQDDVSQDANLSDLGEIALRDLERSEYTFALAHFDLSSDVPLTRVGDASTRHFPASLTPSLRLEGEIVGVVADVVTEVFRGLLALQVLGRGSGRAAWQPVRLV
jgi:class 3 adenylate cyclase